MAVSNTELQQWLKQWPQTLAQFELIVLSLKRRQLCGSYPCARATLEILRSVLGSCRFTNAEHMMKVVRSVGAELIYAAPSELSIGNLVRRILFVIREEYANKIKNISRGEESAENLVGKPQKQRRDRSMSSLSAHSTGSQDDDLTTIEKLTEALSTSSMTAAAAMVTSSAGGGIFGGYELNPTSISGVTDGESSASKEAEGAGGNTGEYSLAFDMRQVVMAGINEINEEMDNVNMPIAEGAQEHIHSDECIMALGDAHTVELFLKAAAKRRRFQVIVAAQGQRMVGHRMASVLAAHPNIAVTLVPETAVYALMSRVHKVVFSPQAVMADGGSICQAGLLMTILAAKEHSVPVVGVTGMYKLCPLFSHSQSHVLDTSGSPSDVLPYGTEVDTDKVEVLAPSFDFIPPEFIDLYITNNGAHQPSYIYRLLSEFFHPQDYLLQ